MPDELDEIAAQFRAPAAGGDELSKIAAEFHAEDRSTSETDAPEPAPTFGGMARAAGEVITAPSRYGAEAGRAAGEQVARDVPGKFGMDPSPEGIKQGGRIGATAGHFLGKGLELMGLSALMPGGAAAGEAALETLGQQAGRRALHSGLTMGADEAAQAAADGEGAGGVAKAGARGAAFGGALGVAGSVPGISEFYLSPRFQDGIMKAIMPRLLGTAAEAGVGVADSKARGGSNVDAAETGALFALFGYLNSGNFSARDRAAAMDSAIAKPVKAMVDAGAAPEQAVATARGALQQELGAIGQADAAIKAHPNFQKFLVELQVKIANEHPELSPEQAAVIADSEAAKLFMHGEVSLETLGKMKMDVKPGEAAKPEAEAWADAADPGAPAQAQIEGPEQVPDAEAQAMEQAVQAAQERGGGGDPGAIRAAMAMPPDRAEEAPPAEAAAPAEEDGDISFFTPADQAEEVLRGPATFEELAQGRKDAEAPVHELAPQDLAQRFPDASPEVQERLLRRVAQAGYPISPEAAKAFPGLQADIAEGARAAALKATQEEGGSTRPGSDLLKARGGIDSDVLKKNGEHSETKDIKGGVIKKGGFIQGWDHAAEMLHEAGLIRERDAEMAKEFIIDESRKPLERGMGPGAASKASLKVKARAPDLLPEEVLATLEAGGIKVGAKVPLIRGVKDPVFGKIAKGAEVKVLALDVEGGNAIIEYKDPANLIQTTDIAVVPVSAMAKVVRNAPPPETKPSEVKPAVKAATGIDKGEKTVKMTELEALKTKLSAEARGAQAAQEQADKTLRAKLKESSNKARGQMIEARKVLRHTIREAIINSHWEQATRNKIVEFARAFLPPAERGALLSTVANAKSPASLLRAFEKIDEKATASTNKKIMGDIRILADRMLNSKTFPISVKDKLRGVLDGIRIENWSKKTIEKVMLARDFVDTLAATGEDVEIPRRILDDIEKLSARPLEQLDPRMLEGILLDMRFLLEQGKDIRGAMKSLDDLRHNEAVEAIAASTKKISSHSTRQDVRGLRQKSLSFFKETRNKYLKVLDFFQEAGVSIRPNQVVVDEFGPEHRLHVFDPMDDGYSLMEVEYGKAVDFVNDLVAKYGVPTEERQDAITTVLMREQEGGREKMYQLGDTDETIDAVTLTPDERAIADALRGYLGDPARARRLAYAAAKLDNQEFKEVKNRWPMKTDFRAMARTAAERALNTAGNAEQSKMGAPLDEVLKNILELRRKNVDRGLLQERKEGAKQLIRRDIFGVFLDDIRQAAIITNLAEPLRRAKRIVMDPRYLESAGDVPQDFFVDLIDTIARDGMFPKTKVDVAVAAARYNLSRAYIWGMPHVGLLQLSMIGNAAGITGTGHAAAAMVADSKWDGFVKEHMPFVRQMRAGDVAVREVLDGKLLPGVFDGGFKHITAANEYAAEKTALMAYFQWCDVHGVEPDVKKPHPQGIAYARQVVGKAGSSPRLIDMPLALSRGRVTGRRELDRMLLQFAGDSLAKGGLAFETLLGRKGGSKTERAHRAAWLSAGVLYEAGVRTGWAKLVSATLLGLGVIGKAEFDKRAKRDDNYWRQAALSALDGIPPVGQFMRTVMNGSTPIPIMDVGIHGLKAMGGMFDRNANVRARALVDALAATAALVFGAPLTGAASQVIRAGMKESARKKEGGSW